jgi:hypothetical protein
LLRGRADRVLYRARRARAAAPRRPGAAVWSAPAPAADEEEEPAAPEAALPAALVAEPPAEEAAEPADEAPEPAAPVAEDAPEPAAPVPLGNMSAIVKCHDWDVTYEEAAEPAPLVADAPALVAEPPAPATPPMPKMVVEPVVVVNEEPEADTSAVKAEVVIALLDSVPLPEPALPETVEVTVAVEDAPEPVREPEPPAVPAADDRTERAEPVAVAGLAVEE